MTGCLLFVFLGATDSCPCVGDAVVSVGRPASCFDSLALAASHLWLIIPWVLPGSFLSESRVRLRLVWSIARSRRYQGFG